MSKIIWKPATILNPVPVVMVTCADAAGNSNIITLAWVGTVNSEPPMLSISVRKERFSHAMIKDRGEFVVNIPTEKLAFATDYCGVKSGRDEDKFKAMKLTRENASKVSVPLIKECPINIECVVKNFIELGSHDLFIAQVVAVNVEDSLIDVNGKLQLNDEDLICYSHGEYLKVKGTLGHFGFSVRKKEKEIAVNKKPSGKPKRK